MKGGIWTQFSREETYFDPNLMISVQSLYTMGPSIPSLFQMNGEKEKNE